MYALQVAKKVANVRHPLCTLKGFLFVIIALQVARKIASCNMAFRQKAGVFKFLSFEEFSVFMTD